MKTLLLSTCLMIVIGFTDIGVAKAGELNPDTKDFKKWNRVVAEETLSYAPMPITLATVQAVLDKYKDYAYVTDSKLYKTTDYWASRAEFNKAKAGDCEDFTIAYYFDLLEAGFDEKDLRLDVAFKKHSQELHAILEITIDNQVYIMDSEFAKVQSVKHLDDFIVAYKINRLGWERAAKKN